MPATTEPPIQSGSFADVVMTSAAVPPDSETNKGDYKILKPGEKPPETAAKEKAEADAKAASDKAASDKAAAESKASEDAKKAAETKAPSEEPGNPNLRGEVAPKKDEELTRPKGMDDKAFVKWKDLHAAAKERDTLKAEFEAFKAEAGKAAPEMESIKKELADTKAKLESYEGELSISRVEGTKHWKETIAAPIKDITTGIEELAKRYEIPPKTLLDAIQETDPAKRASMIDDAVEDFKRADQLDVVTAARDYARLQKQASDLRANAAGKLSELEKQTKADEDKRAAQNAKDYRLSAKSAWEKALANTPMVKKVEGANDWNAILDAQGREIEEINVNDLDVDEVASMAAASKLVPHLVDSVNHLQKQLKAKADEKAALEAKLAAYIKSAPGAGTGSNGGNEPAKPGFSRLAEGFPLGR